MVLEHLWCFKSVRNSFLDPVVNLIFYTTSEYVARDKRICKHYCIQIKASKTASNSDSDCGEREMYSKQTMFAKVTWLKYNQTIVTGQSKIKNV